MGFFALLKRNQKINYDNGWKKEVNIVSWNGGDPKYDIRSWNQDRTKMGKGVTLSSAEIEKLRELLG